MMIDQYPGKSKIHANKIKKMPLPPPKYRTAYGTYLYFAETGELETFIRDYNGYQWTIFKKYESKAAGNIGTAARLTVPGIGTGNPGTISSSFVENGAWMI